MTQTSQVERPAAAWPSPRDLGSSRLPWCLLLLGACVTLLLARYVEPHPSGYGSHTQLGLPPCGMLLYAGIPCPGCGLTTSFAHMARGHLYAAWQANPAGTFLFSLCALAPLVAAVALHRRWSFVRVLSSRACLALPIAVILAVTLSWVVRLV